MASFGTNIQDVETKPYRLPASAYVGRVRLAVSNLQHSVAFYTRIIGLAVVEHTASLARLAAQGGEQILLELEERPGVQPIAERSRLGLYHTAFLLPTREDLSSFVRHLRRLGVGFGAGDHLVSEAIYLVDPDGLEVEVYADRPRDQWPRAGSGSGSTLRMGTQPVRFDTLPPVAEGSWKGAPVGTTVGHVHFYVGDMREAQRFYCTALGLDITVRIPSALFTSAGGYHHHVGLNVWAAGSPAAGENDARLLYWELMLPSASEVDRTVESLTRAGYLQVAHAGGPAAFTDPWGITGMLVSE